MSGIKRKGPHVPPPDLEVAIPAWQRNLFSSILANIDDGISVQDRDMRIVYANAAQKRMFGDDLEGRYCYQIYERRPKVCPDCPVVMTYSTGKPFRTTHHGQDKNGNHLAAEIVATPVFDENGEIVAGIEVVRIVTEQEKARDEISNKSEKLQRLASIAKEIASGLDLSSILSRVVQNATALTGAEAGTVALYDEQEQVIRYPHNFNLPPALAGLVVPAATGVAGYVIERNEPVILDDYASHPAHIDAFVEAGIGSILAVPLKIGDRTLGVLELLGRDSEKKFTQSDLEDALSIADQAAMAIENANLFEETRERLRVQQELNKVAISITSGLDLDGVLTEVAHQAAEIVRADAAMIALLDEENELVSYPYYHNLPPDLSQTTGRVGSSVAGDVIRNCRARIDNDYASEALSRPEFVAAGVTAVATVPLMIARKCVGAIGAMDKGSGRQFTQEDLETLTIVSNQAAVAVENARLYEELSRSAQKLEVRVKERTEALSRMFQESERKSSELQEANLKLREVDRLKSEFLANMSHELRTPLNSIIGFSKLVLDGLDGEINEEQRNDLNIVHANGQELLRLIDDILNLAKIEAGRVNLMLAETPPEDIVNSSVITMTSSAAEKGLTLEAHVPGDLKIIRADAGKLRQVMLNLIGNAIKFTREGRIDVSIEQTDKETVFSVKDSGIGIEKEHLDEIFERFHQATPSSAGQAGVGLGLTISKRFVEMHHGRIWVESELGNGSIFHFAIPRRLDD